MNDFNTEIAERFRRVDKSKVFNRILSYLGLTNKRVLDIGCGFGEYLSRFGKGSYGITTTEIEVDYGKDHKLNIIKGNIEEIDVLKSLNKFEVVWANNLFEHLLSPHRFLIQLKIISNKDTRIILGVPVIPKIVTLLKLNKFRGALASNHISFYTKDTLKYTVEFAGWKVEEIRPFIFSNSFLDRLVAPIAPHLYLIAKNDNNFSYPPKKQKEWSGENMYRELFDILQNKKI